MSLATQRVAHVGDTAFPVTGDDGVVNLSLPGTWAAGDYKHFDTYLESGALEYVSRLEFVPKMKVLDVGCGCGQIAILAARNGASVTGVDISPTLLAAARTRARAEDLDIRLDLGDAELLPYKDCQFDVVVSMSGAMFASDPDRAAAELIRVCRPGGYIAMANWTPTGLFGQMFEILGRHARVGYNGASPFSWGRDAVVKERLRSGTDSIRTTRRFYPMRFPFPPSDVVEFFRLYYGPVNRAFAALDFAAQGKLRTDLDRLWTDHNHSSYGTTEVDAEYLDVVGKCASRVTSRCVKVGQVSSRVFWGNAHAVESNWQLEQRRHLNHDVNLSERAHRSD